MDCKDTTFFYRNYFTLLNFCQKLCIFPKKYYLCSPILLDVAQLVAHLVRDQEVAGSSPVIQTQERQAFRLAFFVVMIQKSD